LNFEFSSDTDDIILSHTVPVSSTGFAIDDTTSLNFAENSVVFQCRYDRSINVDESMTIDPDAQPEVGRGDLTYSMTITSGAVGGTTTVQITPNHNFSNDIGARLVSCNVSHGEHDIYAFHSFVNDQLCRDHSRLNVVQTEFGQNLSFDMRTFRFITTGTSASQAQDQTMACYLYLEPVNDVTSTQPEDCSCHTEADCATPALDESNGAVFMMSSERNEIVPLVIGFNGESNDEINFTFEDTTLGTWDIYSACAVTFNNEMWLLGGIELDQRRKIRKVTNCALKDVGELDFEVSRGGCNAFEFGIMLCFTYRDDAQSYDAFQECHSFD